MPPLLSQSYSNTESSTKTALFIPFVGESTQSTFWSRPPRPWPVVSTRKRLRKTDSVFTKQSSVSSFNMYWVLVPRAQGVLESVVFKTLFVFVALRYPCTYFHNFLTVALKKKKNSAFGVWRTSNAIRRILRKYFPMEYAYFKCEVMKQTEM